MKRVAGIISEFIPEIETNKEKNTETGLCSSTGQRKPSVSEEM